MSKVKTTKKTSTAKNTTKATTDPVTMSTDPVNAPLDPPVVPDTNPGTTPTPPADTPPADTPPADTTPAGTNAELATCDGVSNYLGSSEDDLATKLTNIVANGPGSIRSLISSLSSFATEMGPNVPMNTPEYTIGKIYGIYNLIKRVIQTEDAAEQKVMMDIINLIVSNNSSVGEAFYPTRLLRYDYLWSWGDATLKTHQMLVVIITSLADPSTRSEALTKINVDNGMVADNLDISKEDLDRLMRYYNT